MPDETFVATANAILLNGATPVLVDIENIGYNVSVESIEKFDNMFYAKLGQ